VRPVNCPRLTPWLKKVVFGLHETFSSPLRTIENPDIVVPLSQKNIPGAGPVESFELTESGYGNFMISVRLYFHQSSMEKWQARTHYLQLESYGDDELKARQDKEGIVRSEQVEIIEFNEPTEALWDRLTSEEQFLPPVPLNATGGKGTGKGKGKAKARASTSALGDDFKILELSPASNSSASVSPAAGTVWNQESEDRTVAQLQDADKQAEEQLVERLRRRKDVGDIMAKMKEGHDVEDQIRKLAEDLGLLPVKK
jgi:YEATS domain-containing protein 4